MCNTVHAKSPIGVLCQCACTHMERCLVTSYLHSATYKSFLEKLLGGLSCTAVHMWE